MFPKLTTYCHTLENKSSSPPKPPLGLVWPPLPPAAGPLLVHPPNSSSAETLGDAIGLKPPDAPGTMGVLAKAPPVLPQPKSLAAGFGGSGAFWMGAGAGAAGAAGAPQSLPPQTSAPEKPPIEPAALAVVVVLVGAAAGGLWGEERLKTELVEATAGCGGGGDVVTGAERSKRSPIAED